MKLKNGISGGGPRMCVVMPNYNHGHLIEQALVAISRQTMLPYEVVVVDDGSTDDSVKCLQSLAAEMPWLRVHRHCQNRGVNAAINTGLEIISGDFVLVSAADDRLSAEMVERAFAAAVAFPRTGIIFSDHAEMTVDGVNTRVAPLDLPQTRRYFSGDEFIRLMQSNYFCFHVSSVWFDVALLRELGGFPPDVRWHGDLLAAYAAAFEAGAVYTPHAVSYVRASPTSYGTAGSRSNAQLEVLRAWHATTKRPGWERRRAALVAAAILPEYSLRALRVLLSDLSYLTPRLALRLVWFPTWTKLAPFVGMGVRRRMRSIRTRYRRAQWYTE
jgi:glycosyltransferase involved in cell wall biosynthesis